MLGELGVQNEGIQRRGQIYMDNLLNRLCALTCKGTQWNWHARQWDMKHLRVQYEFVDSSIAPDGRLTLVLQIKYCDIKTKTSKSMTATK
jgi:hypothetical protein